MRAPVVRARTHSAEETRALAAALAELGQPGDLLLLAGGLGAGKTAFAQGYGAGLGVVERVTSPTFTLVNHHQGRLLLNHVDVYRLEQLDEVLDLGLEELLDGACVTIIEWGDAIRPALPPDYLQIALTPDEDDEELRTIELHLIGARWGARRRAITTALTPWLEADEAGGPPAVPAGAGEGEAAPEAAGADVPESGG
jgi:tRNA threonylcarbamoyladenosine biosynthesis protein TsaE